MYTSCLCFSFSISTWCSCCSYASCPHALDLSAGSTEPAVVFLVLLSTRLSFFGFALSILLWFFRCVLSTLCWFSSCGLYFVLACVRMPTNAWHMFHIFRHISHMCPQMVDMCLTLQVTPLHMLTNVWQRLTHIHIFTTDVRTGPVLLKSPSVIYSSVYHAWYHHSIGHMV